MIKTIDELFTLDEKRTSLIKKGDISSLKKTYSITHKVDNDNTASFWTNRLEKETYSMDYMKIDRINTVSEYLIKYSKKNNLNIGVGDGELERELKVLSNDTEIIGLDITYSGLKDALQKTDFPAICSSIKDLPFKKDSLQLVSVLEVLEHLIFSEILDVLDSINSILKKNGYLLISVPVNEKYSSSYNPNRHYRRYSGELIMEELKMSGFEILEFEYLFAFSKYYYLKKYLARSLLKKRWQPNVIIIVARKT